MKSLLLTVTPALRGLAKISLWLSATGIVLMTAMVAWQVFGRFVLNDTPTWTETTSILIMGWFIFLGAAVGIREGYHLSFDVVLYFMPERGRRILHTISDLVVLGFSVCMAGYGIQLAAGTWSSTVPNLGISGGIVFLALVAGGVLMSIFSLERLARRHVGLGTARFGEESPSDL